MGTKEEKNIILENCVGEIGITYRRTIQPLFKISDAANVFEYCLNIFDKDTIEYRESFKVLYVDNKNRILSFSTISEGGTCSTIVDIKMIFQGALMCNANKLIIVHNHPSGEVKPSKQDFALTKQVQEAGKILGIHLMDSVIIAKDAYYSFMDNGDIF